MKVTGKVKSNKVLLGNGKYEIENEITMEIPNFLENDFNFKYAVDMGWIVVEPEDAKVTQMITVTEDKDFVNGSTTPPKKGKKVRAEEVTPGMVPEGAEETKDSTTAE